jgi:hypothetical protein
MAVFVAVVPAVFMAGLPKKVENCANAKAVAAAILAATNKISCAMEQYLLLNYVSYVMD